MSELKSKSISKVEKAAYTDLLELNKRVEGDNGILKELVGKNILMLLGTTGTGKSTMANAFTVGPENIEQTEDGKYVAKNTDHITNETQGNVFKIGHLAKSETTTPTFYQLDNAKSLYLVDAPGLYDNTIRKEYSNQTAVKEVLKKSKSFHIVLLMDA